MKNIKNKFLKVSAFVQELGREVDFVVSKLFKNIGILIISICLLLLCLLWYIAFIFEKESLFFLLVFFLIVILVNNIIHHQLPANSKFRLVIRFLTILGILIFIGFIMIGVGWEVFGYLKGIYNWVVNLFS